MLSNASRWSFTKWIELCCSEKPGHWCAWQVYVMLQHGPRAVWVGSQKLWAMDPKKVPPSGHPFFGYHLTTPLWWAAASSPRCKKEDLAVLDMLSNASRLFQNERVAGNPETRRLLHGCVSESALAVEQFEVWCGQQSWNLTCPRRSMVSFARETLTCIIHTSDRRWGPGSRTGA